MILEPDDFSLHLEITGTGSIRCHGTGMHRITIHKPGNRTEICTADLTGTTVQEIKLP